MTTSTLREPASAPWRSLRTATTASKPSRSMSQLSSPPEWWSVDAASALLEVDTEVQEPVVFNPAGEPLRVFDAGDWDSSPQPAHGPSLSLTLSEVDELLGTAGGARTLTPTASAQDTELQSALSDLENAVAEAHDEGFSPPSADALRNAEQLLRSMHKLHQHRFEVYPTQDREVAIYVPGGQKRSVLVLCDSNGGVLCSVNLNGQHRRAVYDSSTALPDGFIREALADLRD